MSTAEILACGDDKADCATRTHFQHVPQVCCSLEILSLGQTGVGVAIVGAAGGVTVWGDLNSMSYRLVHVVFHS